MSNMLLSQAVVNSNIRFLQNLIVGYAMPHHSFPLQTFVSLTRLALLLHFLFLNAQLIIVSTIQLTD